MLTLIAKKERHINRRMLQIASILVLAFISCEKTLLENETAEVLDVKIVMPVNGQVITGPITIQAAVQHSRNIASVDFFVDSLLMGRDSTSPYSYYWNAGFFADGKKHDLLAKVLNDRGKTAESPKVSVTVDTTAAALRIVYPFEGSFLNGPVTIKLDTTSLTNVHSVTYYIDGQVLDTNKMKPFEQYWVVGFWADGQAHQLNASAIDSFSRIGRSQNVSVIVPNSSAIWPEIVGPINNEFFENTVRFTWKSVPTAITYTVEARELPASVDFSSTTTDTSVEWNAPQPSLYAWRVRAKNNLGRFSSWSPFAEFATAVTFSKVLVIQGGGGLIMSTQEVPTGGYVLAAQANFYESALAGKTVRLNKKGDIMWEKNHAMVPAKVKGVSDGYLVIGSAAILKLNNEGTEIWSKTYSPFGAQGFADIAANDDGTFYLVGFVIQTLKDMSDPVFGWLLKLTSGGDTLWTRLYRSTGRFYIDALGKLGNGSLALAGSYQQISDSIYYPPLAWLTKTDDRGDTLWQREFQFLEITTIRSIAANPGVGIVLGGNVGSSLWLAKVDENGVLVWSNIFSMTGNHYAASVIPTVGGGYVATGGFHPPQSAESVSLMAVDENGNQRWFKQYGTSAYPRSITQTSDGGFLIGGTIIANFGNQPWLVKTDRNGRIRYTD